MNDNVLRMWTVYEKPLDFPDSFVARLFLIGAGGSIATNQLLFGKTLDEIRLRLPPGLTRIPREPEDQKQIVETWI
jgi:hypothetical protein